MIGENKHISTMELGTDILLVGGSENRGGISRR